MDDTLQLQPQQQLASSDSLDRTSLNPPSSSLNPSSGPRDSLSKTSLTPAVASSPASASSDGLAGLASAWRQPGQWRPETAISPWQRPGCVSPAPQRRTFLSLIVGDISPASFGDGLRRTSLTGSSPVTTSAGLAHPAAGSSLRPQRPPGDVSARLASPPASAPAAAGDGLSRT
jgi:hypothetical protein